MIKAPSDVLAYVLIGIMLCAFSMMVYGYAILLRQALCSGARLASLKRVWNWRGVEHLVDERGRQWIYRGAIIAGIVFGVVSLLLLVYMLK